MEAVDRAVGRTEAGEEGVVTVAAGEEVAVAEAVREASAETWAAMAEERVVAMAVEGTAAALAAAKAEGKVVGDLAATAVRADVEGSEDQGAREEEAGLSAAEMEGTEDAVALKEEKEGQGVPVVGPGGAAESEVAATAMAEVERLAESRVVRARPGWAATCAREPNKRFV
jgi:hypothetical protein